MTMNKGDVFRGAGTILAILIAVGALLPVSAQAQASNGTRLHRVDQLSSAVQQGSGSTAALAQLVVEGAYNADLAASSTLSAELSAAQSSFVENPTSRTLTVLNVTTAFDAWRNLIGDPDTASTSPLDLYRLRVAFSTVAPSLVTKDSNGIPSRNVSPVEALYFFDFLIAHGAVPPVTGNTSKPKTSGYAAAVSAYTANTSPSQRQADILGIVNQYLLPESN
jgi:hypothetical protein